MLVFTTDSDSGEVLSNLAMKPRHTQGHLSTRHQSSAGKTADHLIRKLLQVKLQQLPFKLVTR